MGQPHLSMVQLRGPKLRCRSPLYEWLGLDAGVVDASEDAPDVSVHFMVGDTQDAEPARGKDRVALSISIALLVVNRAVNFDNEAGGVAIEINYETAKDMLAPEVKTHVVMAAQVLPENTFLWSHISTQRASPLSFSVRSTWYSRSRVEVDYPHL